MALNAGEIMVHLKADTSGLRRGLQGGTRELDSFLGAASKVTGIVATLAGAAGIGTLISKSVKLAGSLEQARIGFATMLGSAEKAEKMVNQLRDLADITPFRFEDLQEEARLLMGFGFSAEEVIPILTRLGDAAAAQGRGAFEIHRMVIALGQMRGKGRVMSQEMNQLTEAGLNAWKFLATKLGVDIPKAFKKVEEGAVPALVGIEAIMIGLSKAPYVDAMERQSQTLVGLWSTTQDKLDRLFTHIGEKLVATFDLKDVLRSGIEFLDDFNEKLGDNGLAAALDVAAAAFPNLTFAAYNLTSMLSPLADVVLRLNQNLNALGAAVAPFAVVFKPLVDLFQTLAGMRDTMLAMGELALRLAILGGTPIDKIITPTPPGAPGSPILGPAIPPAMSPQLPNFDPALPPPEAGDIVGPGPVFPPPQPPPPTPPFLQRDVRDVLNLGGGPEAAAAAEAARWAAIEAAERAKQAAEQAAREEAARQAAAARAAAEAVFGGDSAVAAAAIAKEVVSGLTPSPPTKGFVPPGTTPIVPGMVDEVLAREAEKVRQEALRKAMEASPIYGSDSVTVPFAEGGIVKGPTIGLIGEAGPEAVVPLDRGTVGNTINITVNGAGDPDAVAGAIVRRLKMKGILAV